MKHSDTIKADKSHGVNLQFITMQAFIKCHSIDKLCTIVKSVILYATTKWNCMTFARRISPVRMDGMIKPRENRLHAFTLLVRR